jgi:hypothetical protein
VLGAVPGLTPSEEWPQTSAVLDFVAGPGGTPVSVEISEPDGEWECGVTVDGEIAELRCAFDHNAVAGGHAGIFYLRAPYRVQVVRGALASSNPCGR